MVTNAWVDNGRYYVGANGAWVKGAQNQIIATTTKQGWTKAGSAWYYYNNGSLVVNKWVGNYWLGADGKMMTNAWVDNNRYYVGANGETRLGKRSEHMVLLQHRWNDSAK